MPDKPRKATRIQSVTRAARLLMLVATLPEQDRSVERFAAELGTAVPTVYHLLNTLVDAGLLARDERRVYRLGLAVDVLAVAHDRQWPASPELLAPLRGVSDATGETAYLSGWRNGEPVLLMQVSGTHAVQVAELRPGYVDAANARAAGKVLLAFASADERRRYLALHPLRALTTRSIIDPDAFLVELADVEQSGYATEVEEFAEGVASLAVPIWAGGILVGSYTIAAPLDRFTRNRSAYLQALQSAAGAFSASGLFESDCDAAERIRSVS